MATPAPRADTLAGVAHPSRQSPYFRLRATLGLLYFVAFFFLFAALLIAPTLWQGYQRVSADPEQWESAQLAVQAAMRPRFWLALALAATATVAGGRFQLLPGSR